LGKRLVPQVRILLSLTISPFDKLPQLQKEMGREPPYSILFQPSSDIDRGLMIENVKHCAEFDPFIELAEKVWIFLLSARHESALAGSVAESNAGRKPEIPNILYQ
jgi:hypothetical protein